MHVIDGGRGDQIAKEGPATVADPAGVKWIPLTSGRRFYIADPKRGDYHLTDIARGLARTRRWAGQGERWISVAQHCCEVERLVHFNAIARCYDDASIVTVRRCALMHDATEALGFGDVSGPVKLLCPDYVALERRAQAAIFGHFGLPWPMPLIVDEADRMVCPKEWRLLFGDPVPLELAAIEPEKRRQLVPWDEEQADTEWLHRWLLLSGEAV